MTSASSVPSRYAQWAFASWRCTTGRHVRTNQVRLGISTAFCHSSASDTFASSPLFGERQRAGKPSLNLQARSWRAGRGRQRCDTHTPPCLAVDDGPARRPCGCHVLARRRSMRGRQGNQRIKGFRMGFDTTSRYPSWACRTYTLGCGRVQRDGPTARSNAPRFGMPCRQRHPSRHPLPRRALPFTAPAGRHRV